MATSKRPPPLPPVGRRSRPPGGAKLPGPRPKTLVQRPTSGRILRYTYEAGDLVRPGLAGTSRPCIVVDAYGDPNDDLGELYDVVVFTSGERDFVFHGPAQQALVRSGTLSRVGVRLTAESKPGCIHWPPGGTR